MTHTEDLIFRLRDTASRGVSAWGDLQQEAADELMGMWKRIEANEGYIQMMAEQLLAERLATELAVDAEQEACAKVCDDNADIEHWQDEKSGGIRTGLHAKLISARGQASHPRGECMSEGHPKLTVIPSSNQKAMGQDLMDELRQVINAHKYDHMATATVIGVLEMTKLHYWQFNLTED